MTPLDIDVVNAHATATKKGDPAELKALERLFGDPKLDKIQTLRDKNRLYEKVNIDKSRLKQISVVSHKGNTGHTMGASGGMETIFAIKCLQSGIVPHTLNLKDPIPTDLHLVMNAPEKKNVKNLLKTSYGFGGVNACMVLGQLNN